MKEAVLKLLLLLFAVIMILSLIGMAFGPFGYETLSVTLSVVAGAFSLLGIAVAFRFWAAK